MTMLDLVETRPHPSLRPPASPAFAPHAARPAPLRIGFDMDGVLADLSSAYHAVEERLFGRQSAALEEEIERPDDAGTISPADGGDAGSAAAVADAAALKTRTSRRRRQAVWNAIRATPDFWMSLRPLEEGSVRRIHAMMLRHRWEVVFITQRPRTDGDTVQKQSQRWLVEQGFDLPTVVVLGGSRGAAAGVLGLNYHLDDSPQNCLDVLGESTARPILLVPADDEGTVVSARKLGIGTARSLTACLDILERVTIGRAAPDVLADVAAAVGWR